MKALRLLLIEDEPLAMKHLKRKLQEVAPDWKVVHEAESVDQVFEALKNVDFDLIFSDIELSDGLSFEAFEQIPPRVPVVFTTAYNQYALKAFQNAGIAYLLKPVNSSDLKKCIQNIKNLSGTFDSQQMNSSEHLYKDLINKIQSKNKRLLIKTGEKYYPLDIGQVMYFEYDQITFAYDFFGKKHPLDESLNQLEEHLPKNEWFRINRQQIVSSAAVKVAHQYLGGRLKLELTENHKSELLVSREKATDFKNWLVGL